MMVNTARCLVLSQQTVPDRLPDRKTVVPIPRQGGTLITRLVLDLQHWFLGR